ncbi:hypothetical protein [Streptomyces antimicrobicus]|uniref:Uncharacterized protein n=1 Tax=Streptomyces antimicrobicus TaxID=2883108 RepID=A0ABS8BAV8_9ACTN|nr:hypothetical protein [Streptomyces antimicrobicus]MCB5181755.1 hypothetical protein [Streptomyces antimicrobicus]
MPGRAVSRVALLLGALLLLFAAAGPARAEPVGTADGPGDVALAIGLTTAAAAVTGLWLRRRYRRDEAAPRDGGEP